MLKVCLTKVYWVTSISLDSVPKFSFSNFWVVFQFFYTFPIFFAKVNTILAQGPSFYPVQTLAQVLPILHLYSSLFSAICKAFHSYLDFPLVFLFRTCIEFFEGQGIQRWSTLELLLFACASQLPQKW